MTEPFKITEPGIYVDVPESDYHQDPCPTASLSSSIAKLIIDQSPAHARQKHPRLVVQDPTKTSVDRDIGKACHALVFGGAPITVVQADDWTKKSDQATRKDVYAAGGIPLLTAHYDRAAAMAAIARPMIVQRLGDDFLPEAVIAWQEGSAWCRTALDGLSRDLTRWVDLKTSGAECDAVSSAKRFYSESHDVQCGFQSRGLDAIDKDGRGRRACWYLYIENDAPFGCTPIKVTEAMMTLARRKAMVATGMWRTAMSTGVWRNYPTEDVTPEIPTWAEQSWMNREMNDATVKKIIADFGASVK